ncbi:ankyrin repeat-containing domain protein [Zopfochytrium polystomum]|nr:ankyrin repeat-containing domain protein [Zopfochytrium polystomum]
MSNTTTSSPSSFALLRLPPTVIARVGLFFPGGDEHRLALPSSALVDSRLVAALRDPGSIAARAVAHFGSPARALLAEIAQPDGVLSLPVLEHLVAHVGDLNHPVESTRKKSAHDELLDFVDMISAGLFGHHARPRAHADVPLVRAARRGHAGVVEMLLRHGADARAQSDQALVAAASAGDVRTVEGSAALGCAAKEGHMAVMELLVERGARIPAGSYHLELAVESGRVEVVAWMLERAPGADARARGSQAFRGGADVNADEGAALQAAAGAGSVEAVRRLLECGADAGAEGCGAVAAAAMAGSVELMELLRERGADVSAINDLAIALAAKAGRLEAVRWLVEECGVDPGAKRGGEAVANASEGGHMDVVAYLVERGADARAGRDAALVAAAGGGHLAVVEFLLERGADAEAQEGLPLVKAVKSGNNAVVKALLLRGGDVLSRNREAFMIASEAGQEEITTTLTNASTAAPSSPFQLHDQLPPPPPPLRFTTKTLPLDNGSSQQ